jgi:hypothetical protein
VGDHAQRGRQHVLAVLREQYQPVNASAEFPYGVWPLGVQVGGGLRPGVVTGFLFEAIATQFSVSFQPWIACLPMGTINLPPFRGRGDGTAGAYRIHVRTKRICSRRHVRVRLGCRRGQRLGALGLGGGVLHPPSAVAAGDQGDRAPSPPHSVGARTDVTAPAGVGDNERVELQVTTVCLP